MAADCHGDRRREYGGLRTENARQVFGSEIKVVRFVRIAWVTMAVVKKTKRLFQGALLSWEKERPPARRADSAQRFLCRGRGSGETGTGAARADGADGTAGRKSGREVRGWKKGGGKHPPANLLYKAAGAIKPEGKGGREKGHEKGGEK